MTTLPYIDDRLAKSILNTLGYTLEDLSPIISGGDISHQLYRNNSFMGYVWSENGIYYTSGENNYQTAERAAIDLLDARIVNEAIEQILVS
jgi:hypothetical protein